jgi:hypothetical protein
MSALIRVRSFISEVWAILRQEGIVAATLRCLDAAGFYRRMIISSGPAMLPPEAPEKYATDLNLTFEELGEISIDDYRLMRPDHSRQQIWTRFDRAEVCVMARHDGLVVGASWIAPEIAWIEYLECTLPLAEDVVYIYDTHVDPKFRGRRVINNLGLIQREKCVKLGARRFAGAIWDRNRYAAGLHERRSRTTQGEIIRIKLGPWQRVWIRHADESEPLYLPPA